MVSELMGAFGEPDLADIRRIFFVELLFTD